MLLATRLERAAKERQTSVSIFSRGRGSHSSSTHSNGPERSPRPSFRLASGSPIVDIECTPAARSPEPDVAPSSEVTPTLFLKPRQKASNPSRPTNPASPRPSSKDWTLDLESPLSSLKTRRRPSFTLRSPLCTAARPDTQPPQESEENSPCQPRTNEKAAVMPETPPLSPTSPMSGNESSTDISGPLTPDSATFKFNGHPYTNVYSLSLASRSSPSHPVLDSRGGPPVTASRPSECLVTKHKETSSRGVNSSSRWWLDCGDEDIWEECDEDDDMTFYAASASMTSFLNFS